MEKKIKSDNLVAFLVSPAGRGAHFLAGLGMVAYGVSAKNRKGYFLAALGVLPLVAGALDLFLLGPFFGGSFLGDETRMRLHQQRGFPQMGSSPAKWISA